MNCQRTKPALRLQHGLAGSPLVRVNPQLARKLGRPSTGKAATDAQRKAKSRLKPKLKGAITKLLAQEYPDKPNRVKELSTDMVKQILSHENADKILAAIEANPDNLGVLIGHADREKGWLINFSELPQEFLEFYNAGTEEKAGLSTSENDEENNGEVDALFFFPDGAEPLKGPGGTAPRPITTRWKWGDKFDSDRAASIRNWKAEKIKQAVLAALEDRFTPVEMELEPAIVDGGEIIQPAKTCPGYRCGTCDVNILDKWDHLQGKHGWLIKNESAKARKIFVTSQNKPKTDASSTDSVKYEGLQNHCPNDGRQKTPEPNHIPPET
jgi:hypothetical protein